MVVTIANQSLPANSRDSIKLSQTWPSGYSNHYAIVLRTPNDNWVKAYAWKNDSSKLEIVYSNEFSSAISGDFSVMIVCK